MSSILSLCSWMFNCRRSYSLWVPSWLAGSSVNGALDLEVFSMLGLSLSAGLWKVLEMFMVAEGGLLTVEVRVKLSLSWIERELEYSKLLLRMVTSELFCSLISPMVSRTEVFWTEKLLRTVDVCTLLSALMISISCSEALSLLVFFFWSWPTRIICCALCVASTAVCKFCFLKQSLGSYFLSSATRGLGSSTFKTCASCLM